MAQKTSFSKSEAIKIGYNITKKNFLFILGVFVVLILVYSIPSVLQNTLQQESGLLAVVTIFVWILNMIVNMGIINISLKFVDGKKPDIMDLFYRKSLLHFIIVSLVTALIIAVGFVLLIIPGIYLAIRLQFSTYLVVDKGMTFVDAIKKSWKMTEGQVWNLFLFTLLLILLNIAGALLILIGLFVTVPTSGIAAAYVYRKLSS